MDNKHMPIFSVHYNGKGRKMFCYYTVITVLRKYPVFNILSFLHLQTFVDIPSIPVMSIFLILQ